MCDNDLNFNISLKKIDRIMVWALLTLFLIFMISGYMITKGFIDRYYGLLLHTRLDIPIMILFVIHASINVRNILFRWRGKSILVLNIITFLMGSALFLFVLYLDQIFRL